MILHCWLLSVVCLSCKGPSKVELTAAAIKISRILARKSRRSWSATLGACTSTR